MKKSIILSVLGLTAGAITSFGQGTIGFDTYVANGGSGIITQFGATAIGSAYTGELLYSLTPISDPIGTAGNVGNSLTAGWLVGSTGTFGTSDPAGYVKGANLVIPTYTTGPVYFEIVAFNGTSYDNSSIRGHSASFTDVPATGVNTPPLTADGSHGGSGLYSAFNVYSVPEPTTLALAGLGGLASLVALRRKQA